MSLATPPTRYYCTLFDSGYLFKGAVMLSSLRRHCPGATVFVLCMDKLAGEILELMGLEGCVCIPLSAVETGSVLAAKANRNIAEYCWTLSSCFTAWLMENHLELDMLTYLDADLMFFSSPEPLFDEMEHASIGIMEHRFVPRLKHLESKGRFCVEWVSFRRDEQGLACLNRWRDQCLEWCYDRLEDGRMGDQKYLDAWPQDYSRTRILAHQGAGVAPWNYSNYVYEQNCEGQLHVSDVPLIFYHFHQFQILDDGRFYRLSPYYQLEGAAPDIVYSAYEAALVQVIAQVRTLSPGFSRGMKSAAQVYSRRWIQAYVPRRLKEFLKRIVRY